MQRLEVSGAMRPIYVSLGVKRLNNVSISKPLQYKFRNRVIPCYLIPPPGNGTSSFLREGGKIVALVYQKDMLQGVVKHLNTTLFNGQVFVLQQDSATANKGKTTHVWLRSNILAFISAKNWPSASPDLKPLDCKHWGYFEGHGLLKASQQAGQPEEVS